MIIVKEDFRIVFFKVVLMNDFGEIVIIKLMNGINKYNLNVI